MTARLLAGGVGLAFLAACTTAPRLPYDYGVGVAEVIRNVRCELATAVAENSIRHPWLRTWAAAVELTLDVTETGGGGVSAEIVVPFNVTNTYGLGANAAQESHARNISSVVFATALVALTPKECDRHTAGGNKGPAMLRGSLGLKNWIARASDSIEATGIVEQANGVGYIIEFGLVSAGGLDPSFTIVKIADFQLGGRMGLHAGRSDIHTLNIAMVPIRPPRPAPVYVTNLGDLKTTTGGPAPKGGGKGNVIVRPAQPGIPEQTQMNLSDIIRSLKQTRTGND